MQSLRGLSHNPPQMITGSFYKGDASVQEAMDNNHAFEVFHYHVLKTMLSYLFEDYASAIKAIQTIPTYISAATSSMPLKIYNLYSSLTHIKLYE